MAKSRRIRRRSERVIDPPLIALVVALALLAIIAYYTSARYTAFSAAMEHPYMLHPPIRMYVGITPNVSGQGLKYATVNQVFCPENSTIQTKQAQTFRFPYYTSMPPGTVFDYSIIYNASKGTPIGAALYKPFTLITYKNSVMQSGPCTGYPNTTGNFTLVLRAPEYNVTGQLEAIVYFVNKTA